MQTDGEIKVGSITIEKEKADKILAWLIRKETENVRTKENTDVRMISLIQERIKEEAECY